MFNLVKNIIRLFNSYKKRGALHIFSSTIINKLSAFLLSIIVIRILTKNMYGDISYAKAIIQMVIPFAGLGANFSLLRFGSIAKDNEKKNNLFRYALIQGTFYSLILLVVVIGATYLFDLKIKTARIYILILSFQLISIFLLKITQSYFRVLKLNKIFAYSQIINSFSLLIVGIILTYFFKSIGLVLAYSIVPLVVFFVIYTKFNVLKISSTHATEIKKLSFWKYGIYVGIGSIASQFMYTIDILLLGSMLADTKIIAIYKVATIIPLNLLFIPSVFMTTDFVLLAEKFKDVLFLKKYAKMIIFLMGTVSLFLMMIILFYSENIIIFIFGESYKQASILLNVLAIGMVASFTFRIPFGNILAAVGKSDWNVIVAYFMLCTNVILDYILINKYGSIGAAYGTTISMWISGFCSLILFLYYVNRHIKIPRRNI